MIKKYRCQYCGTDKIGLPFAKIHISRKIKLMCKDCYALYLGIRSGNN